MSHVNILVHAVWGTKKRIDFLTDPIRKIVIRHILENAKKKDIYIDRINGYTDHLHCIISLSPDMSIAKTMNLIKGESSFWINQQKITVDHFQWADEYFAESISKNDLPRVRRYIDNQVQHHAQPTRAPKTDEMIKGIDLLAEVQSLRHH